MRHYNKKDIIILIGNVIDHFDTALYVFLAPLFAPMLFPDTTNIIGMIMAYSFLPIAMIARPIGVYIFSMIAQNYTPIYSLSLSLIGLGVATFIIGLIPDYHIIGYAAPILLLACQIIRNICAAGENIIARLYLLEDLDTKEMMRKSSMYEMSTMLGIIFASFAATILHYIDFIHAWRLCFFLGGTATILGYCARKLYVDESINTPSKTHHLMPQKSVYSNIMTNEGFKILLDNKLLILHILIISSVTHITYVIPFVTMNHIVPLITNIDAQNMMIMNSVVLIFDMFAILCFGKLITYFNMRNSKVILLVSTTVLSVTFMPLWYYLEGASTIYVNFVRLWIVVWGIIFLCPLNAWYKEKVLGHGQYIIIGAGITLSSIIFGKLMPVISLSLYHYTNSHISIGIYITCLLLAISAMLLRACLKSEIINNNRL